MNPIVSTTAMPLFVLCAVPVFVILFLMILSTLRHIPLFDGNTAVVLALCITLLCMVGLHQVFIQPGNAEAATASDVQPPLNFLLWPYAAMALAMLFAFCLSLVHRMLGSRGCARLRAEIAKHKERLAALRQSHQRAPWDSISRRLFRSHEEGPCGTVEHSTPLKKIQTDQQNKEIRKWKS